MARKLQATSVQDQTWIISSQGERLGLLSAHADGSYQLLGKGIHKQFPNIKNLESELNGQIVWVTPKMEERDVNKTHHVHNLPIKHDAAHDVHMTPHVSYKKTELSDTRFAAGYWILKFSTGWSGSLSPKLDTLAEYAHQGPFSSKLEMNTILAQRNSEFKRDQERP
jgi:hypothetical protein